MREWEIQSRGRIRVVTERKLLRRLHQGRYDADTRVRRVGETEWHPLGDEHEIMAAAGEYASAAGAGAWRWHRIQGILWHAGIWAGVSSFALHWTTPAFIWGFFVGIHVLSEVPKIIRGPQQESAKPLPRSRAIGIWANVESDPFLKEIEAALQALQQAGEKNKLPGAIDYGVVRKAAQELRRQHLALAELADPAARDKLAQERDTALAQARQSKDPRTVEVLQEQARSVNSRLDAIQQAFDAAARLEARERTLLHQIEAFRLSALQTGAERGTTPDLAGDVQRLQSELRAEAEIEATLARARAGAGQAQRT